MSFRSPFPRSRLSSAESPSSTSSSKGLNPLTLVWITSLWLATVGNWPLWRAIDNLPEMGSWRGRLFMLAFCGMVAALNAFVLSLVAWRWSIKPVLAVFLLSAAAGAHFMGTYSAVIDPTMMVNVLQTDLRETRDLMSVPLVVSVVGLGIVPLALLLRARIQPLRAWQQLKRNVLGLLGALAVLVALLLIFYADMSATMRNHKSVRYLVNPLNSFYALGVVATQAQSLPDGPPVAVGMDARLSPPGPGSKPPLIVLVVGETARADHFSLNGYPRPTSRQVAAHEIVNYPQVSSCGTSTAASLPCMFSVFGKDGHEAQKQPHENMLDVLARAGLAVLWIDNQSGCKGLCARIPNASAATPPPGSTAASPLCTADGECYDEALLHGLDARIAALPAERRARGVVVVLHQMGSHGPAYWKRSPPDRKPFQPECQTNVLQQCERQALINSYDNSIAYTDHVLASTIAWLKARAQTNDAAMVYVSDHGESLGEGNLYLHGLPYALAPREQTHVPMLMWLSSGTAKSLRPGCLQDRSHSPYSHDNLAHTILGLSGVRSQVYRESLDLTAPCRLGPTL